MHGAAGHQVCESLRGIRPRVIEQYQPDSKLEALNGAEDYALGWKRMMPDG
jgi:hypothetical protein